MRQMDGGFRTKLVCTEGLWRSSAAAGRCPQSRAARTPGAACRRDAGGDVEAPATARHTRLTCGAAELVLDAYDDTKGVVYDIAEPAAGATRKRFVGDWKGKLVCDDYCRLQGFVRKRDHRSRLHDARQAQVPGPLGQPQQPDRRRGVGASRRALRHRARRCRAHSKRAASDPTGARRRSFIGACKHWDLVRRISATRAALPGDGIANGCVAEVSGSNLVWCDSGRFRERCV